MVVVEGLYTGTAANYKMEWIVKEKAKFLHGIK